MAARWSFDTRTAIMSFFWWAARLREEVTDEDHAGWPEYFSTWPVAKAVFEKRSDSLKEETMPHVIVKLWPGKSEVQKQHLADKITKDLIEVLNCGDKSVSVAFEEVSSDDWKQEVYKPDIQEKWDKLYKKPGYEM